MVTRSGDSLGIQRVEATDEGPGAGRCAHAGDAHAYAGLVARHRDRLVRYARHVLGNREDAEEAWCRTCVRAGVPVPGTVRGRRALRSPGCSGILVNRCRTRYAQVMRRSAVVVHDDIAMSEAEAPADDAGWRDAVSWALERLRALAYREAFLLKHVEDLSYDEMAELTGTGVSALKMRVSRACERLRVMLEEVERRS